ncbi:MAG: hypothetical protein K8R48_01865 [Alphaproteobacteria bacterium]|nr:hypothetical protein [Alphaproteobacteria bacterium]
MAKVTKSLKKSFQNGQKSAFDFDRAVAEAYEMFPHIDGSVFFVDVNAHNIIYPDPEGRTRILAAINGNDSIREDLNTEVHRHKDEKSSSCMQLKIGKKEVYFLLLYLEKDLQSALEEKRNVAQNQHLVFDHELAHALIPNAHGHNVRCESTADVYAALRHFQRYGTQTYTIETLMQRRAALAFINQDAAHFTSQALETALSFKNQFDFKTLKPLEIASMAAYIGSKGSITGKELKSLSYHFNKLKGVADDVKNDQPLRKFAEQVFSARSPAMTKWGKVALQAFLDGKIHLATDKRRLSLHGPYWDNVRHAM